MVQVMWGPGNEVGRNNRLQTGRTMHGDMPGIPSCPFSRSTPLVQVESSAREPVPLLSRESVGSPEYGDLITCDDRSSMNCRHAGRPVPEITVHSSAIELLENIEGATYGV
jgi:hypothetical protein